MDQSDNESSPHKRSARNVQVKPGFCVIFDVVSLEAFQNGLHLSAFARKRLTTLGSPNSLWLSHGSDLFRPCSPKIFCLWTHLHVHRNIKLDCAFCAFEGVWGVMWNLEGVAQFSHPWKGHWGGVDQNQRSFASEMLHSQMFSELFWINSEQDLYDEIEKIRLIFICVLQHYDCVLHTNRSTLQCKTYCLEGARMNKTHIYMQISHNTRSLNHMDDKACSASCFIGWFCRW